MVQKSNATIIGEIVAHWWPVLFGLGYLFIMLIGAVTTETPVLAVDECENIVAGCYAVESADVLGTKDKYEHIASKPTFGNYQSFTYEVLEWGAITADTGEFAVLAGQTMSDPRGWSQGGLSFNEVTAGGDFSLVISEASVLDTIGGCSSAWSCRSGRYVIINQDRWDGATTAWNAVGGSLRDYRHMVINHELGHWLGHGHSYCSGAGNLAFVMQQQSITLGGCQPNPWPLLIEVEQLQ